MEEFEAKWVRVYSSKLAQANGDLGELTEEERKHLSLLMRKYELEQKSAEIDVDLSRAKLL